jgi:Tol biopolymer transport system component
MPLLPGSRLGPYEVTAALGAGGMGEVYRARDTKLGRDVAIKVLPETLADDSERLARFEREAKTLAQLNHPNIAHVHGFEDGGGTRALVMELVEGEDLSTRIARGPIALDDTLAIARQIADGLAAAHDVGIVHRDLKPANIKVRGDGTAKVLDFGLAKALDPATGSRQPATGLADSPTITSPAMTAAGIILGTAAYMSPEQAKGRPVDKRADIWAFGCVLYEMLTGRRAFPGDDVSETLATVLKSEPDWTLLPPETPASIRRLLRRTLNKQVTQRLADIADARFDLNEITEPVTPAVTSKPRRSLAIGVAGFAAGIALTGAMAFLVMRLPAPVAPPPVRFSIPYEGQLRGFDVSPDGQTIAYAAQAPNGGAGVWLRHVDSDTGTLLPNTDQAWAPFWSPDGNSIAFFAGTKLRRVDITGRSAATICDVGSGPNSAAQGSWGDAGVVVFTKNLQAFKVAAEGGAPAAITLRESSERVVQVHVVPGSDRVLLMVRHETGFSTWTVRLDGSDERKLFDGPFVFIPPDHVVVGRRGEALLQQLDRATLEPRGQARLLALGPIRSESFSARAGTMALRSASGPIATELTWFDRSGKSLGVVGEVGDHYMPRLSPDGTKLAVESHGGEGGGDLFVHDLKAGTRTRLTFEPTYHNASATWSPDGSRLAFHSTREGVSLFIKPISGASPEELVLKSDSASPVDWSLNGQFLLIDRTSSGSAGIYRVPLSDASKPEPVLVETQARVLQGQLSPDGTLLAYVSEERAGGEVYVTPYPPTGAKWQVSTKGGHSPRWNRNGRELFYVSPERAIMSVPVVTKRTFSSGTPVQLFQSSIRPRTSDWFHYDVAPDGNRFILVSQRESGAEPIQVIVNWQSLLANLQNNP